MNPSWAELGLVYCAAVWGATFFMVKDALAGVQRIGPPGVFIHHFREELLVQASPVHADPDRLAVLQRDLDDGAEVLVAPLGTHVPGIDPVLGERRRAAGMLGEQQVTVVMEVPDHGDVHGGDDVGDGRGRGLGVDGHAHQLAPGLVQRASLGNRRGDVRRIGVGHGLDDDRVGSAHVHAADGYDDGLSALGHGWNIRQRGVTPVRRLFS
jgi:hypothetical protein